MHDVSLAFLWHQHQPYYTDDLAHETPMPWVRLHGTKDYWGMAMHLKEIPEMRATINLVPSLLAQLLAYTEEGREDTHLRLSRQPADGLSEEDMGFLLDNFFMVHVERMIRPFPRYYELYQKRAAAVDTAKRAAGRFKRQDILDLQCWSNLAWIHPIAFEQDADLQEFLDKGSRWTEDEKQWLLDKQMQLLAQVIPLHEELARGGQVELTTSPYFHPILPLLYDKRLAQPAMPGVQLPTYTDGDANRARSQIESAVACHEKLFGCKPRGMWPSEGSVCQEVIADVADAGIQWIATDEEILSCSTNGWVSRDHNGFLRNPEMLYRPWRVEHEGRQLQIIFRDHAMSDQIGFHYQQQEAETAVDDFLGKLEAIGDATRANAGHRPTLVSIILDGENCWEYYPRGGVDFLRLLYQRVVSHPKITPRRVSDYLERHPATEKLGHLFPGSWIGHSFGIWIGHAECNHAWDLLEETRHFLNRADEKQDYKPEQMALARRELQIGEGSDWFWWFGDDHNSSQDGLFDQLFRKHLQNVYLALDEVPPIELSRPIGHHQARRYTEPTGLLRVKVDGRRTYFEWINAGHVVCDRGRGAMSMATEGLISDLYFGFDLDRLVLRLDAQGASVRERLAAIDTLRVTFFEPEGFELLIAQPAGPEPICQLYLDDAPLSASSIEAATGSILELAIPLRDLQVSIGDPVYFCVELVQGEQSNQRIPQEGAVETNVPSEDFEQIMWQV